MPTNDAGSGSALASIVQSLAWPSVVLIVFLTALASSNRIGAFLERLAQSYQHMTLEVGPQGFKWDTNAKEAAQGLTAAVEKQQGPLSPTEAAKTTGVAQTAALELSAAGPLSSTQRLRVLWVDDQPGNNVGLQYAFEALGIIVVCVEDTDRISAAINATGGFDVVITDMFRDAVRGKPDRPNAGTETITEVSSTLQNVPVIVYAGKYAEAHEHDPLAKPVAAVTNNPQTVFSLITQMAKQKAVGKP